MMEGPERRLLSGIMSCELDHLHACKRGRPCPARAVDSHEQPLLEARARSRGWLFSLRRRGCGVAVAGA